jgi:hypothetical protein
MGFLENRSRRMEKKIFKDISNNPKKVGFSIIFKSKESPAYVYRFIGNTYVVANLEYLNWSVVKYLNELSWEELKRIRNNITFIKPQDSNKWLSKKNRSLLLSLQKKIRKIFIKDPPKKYYL